MIIFLVGIGQYYNLGSEALILANLIALKDIAPSSRIAVESLVPERTLAMLRREGFYDVEVVPSDRLLPPRAIHYLLSSDVLLVGGDHQYADVVSTLLWARGAAGMMVASGAKRMVVLSGIEVGPLSSTFKRMCTAFSLNRSAHRVICRNRESARELVSFGCRPHLLRVGADPTFILDPPESLPINARGHQSPRRPSSDLPVAIAVRAWYYHPVRLDPFSRRPRPTWRNGGRDRLRALTKWLATVCDGVCEEASAKIVFPSFHEPPLPGRFWPSDSEVASDIIAEMRHGNQAVVETPDTPGAAMRLLASCRAVVSMRLHPLVFASRLGIPGIALGIEPKLMRLQAQLGREQWTFSVLSTPPQVITEAALRLLSTPESERGRLRTTARALGRAFASELTLALGRNGS